MLRPKTQGKQEKFILYPTDCHNVAIDASKRGNAMVIMEDTILIVLLIISRNRRKLITSYLSLIKSIATFQSNVKRPYSLKYLRTSIDYSASLSLLSNVSGCRTLQPASRLCNTKTLTIQSEGF